MFIYIYGLTDKKSYGPYICIVVKTMMKMTSSGLAVNHLKRLLWSIGVDVGGDCGEARTIRVNKKKAKTAKWG